MRLEKSSFLKEAIQYCELKKLRLTAPRRAVLSIIAAAEKPVGAYQIIDRMPDGTKPPTVYRAIDFWQAHGFIHRIESLNSYSACVSGHRHTDSQFFICDDCGMLDEIHLHSIKETIAGALNIQAAWLTKLNIEAYGLCKNCQPSSMG